MSAGRFVATVLGRAGSGKSHLLRGMARAARDRGYGPVLALDTMGEFPGVVFGDVESLVDYLSRGAAHSELYAVRADSDEQSAAFFDLIARLQQPCTIIVDEASKHCSPHSIDANLKRIIAYGRHWQTSVICAARRTAELHRDVTAQSDVIISFRQTETGDIKKLQSLYDEARILPDLNSSAYEYAIFGDVERFPLIADLSPVSVADVEARP